MNSVLKPKILASFCATLILLISAMQVFCQVSKGTLMKREIKILKGQTLLNLPVNSSDRMVRAAISVDGKPLDLFTINLAEKNPEFWTFFDVSAYQGKTITIEIADAPDRFPGQNTQNAGKPAEIPTLNSKGLNMIFADSKFPGQDSLYMKRVDLRFIFLHKGDGLTIQTDLFMTKVNIICIFSIILMAGNGVICIGAML